MTWDHRAAAEELLRTHKAMGGGAGDDWAYPPSPEHVARAHVHAMLALADILAQISAALTADHDPPPPSP